MELLKGIQKSLVFAALLCVLTIGAAAYTLTYQTVTGYTGLNVETSTDHPWTVQEDSSLKSGNSGTDSSASVLKVTVTGSGVLHFDYKVSSPLKTGDTNPNNLPTEDVPDSLLIRANAEITADSPAFRKFTANQDRFYGEIDWTPGSVTVDAAEGVETDIFFAFRKDGTSTKGISDCAWLRNITFTTDTSAELAVTYDNTCGDVTGAGSYEAGTTVTLTAQPKDGCQFYGWLDAAGSFLSDELTYSMTVNNNMTVRAVFAQTGTYEARRGGLFFESLSAALANARSGSTVFLLKDTELTQDAEIPSGVTLYIPYEEHYTTDYKNGGVSNANLITATPFRLLTVNSGVTLTVNGTLRLGAEMGKITLCYQGHNNGAYGGVVNEGTIAVNGTLDSWGLITGSGTVTAVGGGTVYEPFIVCDFAGGKNLQYLYQADAAPFKRYAMQNIQCTLQLDSGSTLYGRGCLFGDNSYNEVEIPIAASGGLFQLADGASITRTYDPERQVSVFLGIGRENWTVSGGMTFGALEMNVLGVQISTGKCGFPLPYNMAMTLTNGSYSIPNHLRVMPGAALTVGRKATLTVGGSLYVLDGLKQGSMSGVRYASTEQLKNSGFSVCGELTVDGGKLAVSSSASFGGVVQSTGSGSISIAKGASLTNKVQDGGKGYYADNTAIFEGFTARAYIGGALQNLMAGEYHAVGNDAFTLPSYTVKYVTNGESINSGYEPVYADETVTIDQPMTGAWATGESAPSQYQITAVNKTCYDEADNSCTSVDHELNGDTLTFTVTTLKSAYTHLVQVQMGDGAAVTVKPDEKGTYTVAGVNDDVTIIVTSVLKGDVDLDGAITSNDASTVLRQVAKIPPYLSEIASLTADVDLDGAITSNDASTILRYVAKLIPTL